MGTLILAIKTARQRGDVASPNADKTVEKDKAEANQQMKETDTQIDDRDGHKETKETIKRTAK